MPQPELIPFASERTQELRKKVVGLSRLEPVLDQPQLVRGWLTAGGLSVLYGPSNAGKTFFVVDLAMHVAAGVPWRGNRVMRTGVIYLAAEGGTGIRNRIAAMKQAKPAICEHDRFHLLPTAIDLFGAEDATAIAQLLPDEEVGLIVIDTLARAIGDGDENTARDVGTFVQNADLIREKTGAHVLVVHHSGKDAERGARGSSALRAAVDTEIAITADRCATTPKQRDLAQVIPLHFDLRQVVLGNDAEGEPVTSAIVTEAGAPTAKLKPLSGQNEIAMQALLDAIRDHGETKNDQNYPPSRKVVHKTKWREACDRHGITDGESPTAARTAFNRAKKNLMELDRVREFAGYVWLVHEEE